MADHFQYPTLPYVAYLFANKPRSLKRHCIHERILDISERRTACDIPLHSGATYTMASQPQSSAANPTPDETSIYEQLEIYNWAADSEFQSGLQAILGSTADPARAEHLTLRARCFYFSRYVVSDQLNMGNILNWARKMRY